MLFDTALENYASRQSANKLNRSVVSQAVYSRNMNNESFNPGLNGSASMVKGETGRKCLLTTMADDTKTKIYASKSSNKATNQSFSGMDSKS